MSRKALLELGGLNVLRLLPPYGEVGLMQDLMKVYGWQALFRSSVVPLRIAVVLGGVPQAYIYIYIYIHRCMCTYMHI